MKKYIIKPKIGWIPYSQITSLTLIAKGGFVLYIKQLD